MYLQTTVFPSWWVSNPLFLQPYVSSNICDPILILCISSLMYPQPTVFPFWCVFNPMYPQPTVFPFWCVFNPMYPQMSSSHCVPILMWNQSIVSPALSILNPLSSHSGVYSVRCILNPLSFHSGVYSIRCILNPCLSILVYTGVYSIRCILNPCPSILVCIQSDVSSTRCLSILVCILSDVSSIPVLLYWCVFNPMYPRQDMSSTHCGPILVCIQFGPYPTQCVFKPLCSHSGVYSIRSIPHPMCLQASVFLFWYVFNSAHTPPNVSSSLCVPILVCIQFGPYPTQCVFKPLCSHSGVYSIQCISEGGKRQKGKHLPSYFDRGMMVKLFEGSGEISIVFFARRPPKDGLIQTTVLKAILWVLDWSHWTLRLTCCCGHGQESNTLTVAGTGCVCALKSRPSFPQTRSVLDPMCSHPGVYPTLCNLNLICSQPSVHLTLVSSVQFFHPRYLWILNPICFHPDI